MWRYTSFVFQYSTCNWLNQFKKGTFGLWMLVLQSRDNHFDVWCHGAFAFKFSTSLYFVHFCARQEDYGTAIKVNWTWLLYPSLVLVDVIIACLLSGFQLMDACEAGSHIFFPWWEMCWLHIIAMYNAWENSTYAKKFIVWYYFCELWHFEFVIL